MQETSDKLRRCRKINPAIKEMDSMQTNIGRIDAAMKKTLIANFQRTKTYHWFDKQWT